MYAYNPAPEVFGRGVVRVQGGFQEFKVGLYAYKALSKTSEEALYVYKATFKSSEGVLYAYKGAPEVFGNGFYAYKAVLKSPNEALYRVQPCCRTLRKEPCTRTILLQESDFQ